MNRWIALMGVLALAVASIALGEKRKVDVAPSPAAVLYLVADTEQELTRMPVSFTRLPDEEEIQIGDQLAREYSRSEERDRSQEHAIIEHYLRRVGEQVAANAHRKLPYKFHYLSDSSLINAFALPGGHVYVGGGLLELMDSEDELAAVLGHEIEHIDHFDCAERVQREQALRRIPFGGFISLPIAVFEAGYSKDQELQADRDGTRLAVQAGYSASGAIRMFETFARLYNEYAVKAKSPDEELAQVAEQTLEGYFRSHPLPSERIAQIRKLIASEGWPPRAERDLAVAYIFWTAKAQKALVANKYPQAEQLADHSLKLRPDQPKALQVLALARFAQANFSGAAEAYRQILGIESTSHPEMIAAYAQALAAADRKGALAEFKHWADTMTDGKPEELMVSLAGLELLAGSADAARRMEAELAESNNATAPFWSGELAWWHYQAGDYAKAVELLIAAQQLRPGEMRLALPLAWSLIETRRYADALQLLDYSSDESYLAPQKAMARAVARWQAQQQDEALFDFESALRGQPEWGNPSWVRALYSPLVAQTMQEMQAERERRKQRVGVAR
jgi:beta-barrel assembly-enhancing protease